MVDTISVRWPMNSDSITTVGINLIVQVQVVKLSIGPEMLSMVIQSEVDIPSVALYDNRVPVVIIQ